MINVKETLALLGVKPSKQRGQNFLYDPHSLDKLIKGAKIEKSDVVVEIGPGLGALTDRLIEISKKLYCIEIEKSFIHFLSKKYGDQKDKVTFLNTDFREVDLADLNADSKVRVVSNLPYVFSSEAIFWLIKNIPCLENASLLVQKEFAERIVSKPNTKSFGSITVHTQYFFDVTIGAQIGGNSFYPPTEVESVQLHLKPKKDSPKLESPFYFFEAMVRASFSMRRKKLSNCMVRHFPEYSREDIESKFEECGLSPLTRAENLSVEDFCKLSDSFWHNKKHC